MSLVGGWNTRQFKYASEKISLRISQFLTTLGTRININTNEDGNQPSVIFNNLMSSLLGLCLRESPPQETTISRGSEQATPFLRITMITAKITLSTRNKQTTVQSPLPSGWPAAVGILVHVRLTSKERNRIHNFRKYHQYTDNNLAGRPASVRHHNTRQTNLKVEDIPSVSRQRFGQLISRQRSRVGNSRISRQCPDKELASRYAFVRHHNTRQTNLKAEVKDKDLTGRYASVRHHNTRQTKLKAEVEGRQLYDIPSVSRQRFDRLNSRQRSRVGNCRISLQCPDKDLTGRYASVRHHNTRQTKLKAE
ncbi:hypothetical protein J6590_094677, partial [Homalodisca vitripennis]